MYRTCVEYRTFIKAPCLALSATVTQEVLDDLSVNLMLHEVTVVSVLPLRDNIYLDIRTQRSYMYQDDLRWVVDGLRKEGVEFQKMIIYVSGTISKLMEICMHMKVSLRHGK